MLVEEQKVSQHVISYHDAHDDLEVEQQVLVLFSSSYDDLDLLPSYQMHLQLLALQPKM
jgi:hypothetical protein